MTRFTLPAGINPDLAIGQDGLTVISYQDIGTPAVVVNGVEVVAAVAARGFVVERFVDPATREVLFTQPDAQGYGRLHPGQLAAAFRGVDSAAMGWFGGPLIRYGATLGNYPIAWTKDWNCCVQMPPDFRVSLNGTSAVIGSGVGTGLARVEGVSGSYKVVTWDEDFYVNHLDTAHVLESGDRVSQGHDGGVLCKFGAAEGVILPNENCYEPRVALQANGQYTVIFGGRDTHEATAQTLLTDVSAADFQAPPVHLPPIENIVQRQTKTLAIAYLDERANGVRPSWCNAWIDEGAPDHGGWLRANNGTIFRIIDCEQGQTATGLTGPFAFIGTPDSLIARATPGKYDRVFVECAAEDGESEADQQAKFDENLARVEQKFPGVTPEPIAYPRTNYVLSTVDVANNIEACSKNVGADAYAVFGWGRPDYVSAMDIRLTYWLNGQAAPEQSLPPVPPKPPKPNPPEPDDMPYKTFAIDKPGQPLKDQSSYRTWCNDLGARLAAQLGKDPGPVAPDTGLTLFGGQQINETYDIWDSAQIAAGQVPGTIPSAEIMVNIARDHIAQMPSATIQSTLKHEVPLR